MGRQRILCNQCNVNTIHEFLTLQWNLDKAAMLCSAHLSVACTFSWNHETYQVNYPFKMI